MQHSQILRNLFNIHLWDKARKAGYPEERIRPHPVRVHVPPFVPRRLRKWQWKNALSVSNPDVVSFFAREMLYERFGPKYVGIDRQDWTMLFASTQRDELIHHNVRNWFRRQNILLKSIICWQADSNHFLSSWEKRLFSRQSMHIHSSWPTFVVGSGSILFYQTVIDFRTGKKTPANNLSLEIVVDHDPIYDADHIFSNKLKLRPEKWPKGRRSIELELKVLTGSFDIFGFRRKSDINFTPFSFKHVNF